MKSLASVFVLIVVVSSIAVASDLRDALGGLLKQAAVAKVGEALENRLNRRETVKPVKSGQNLGRIIVSGADGFGWYDDGLLAQWTVKSLRGVGFEALSRQGRDLVRSEMSETREPEFNPQTSQPLGQLNGAQYFAIVSVCQGSGPDRRIRIDQGNVSVESDQQSEWAAVTLSIVDATGAELASVDVEACDSATSLDVSAGWYRGIEYRGWQPTRRDLAVMAACQKAANAVGKQMADQRIGWRFDPQTGKRLDQPTRPTGWRYDPFTGRPISQAENADAPRGAGRQFDPGEPE